MASDYDVEYFRLLDLYIKKKQYEYRVEAELTGVHKGPLTDENPSEELKVSTFSSEYDEGESAKELLQVAIDEMDKSLLITAFHNCQNGLPTLSADDCKKIAECIDRGLQGTPGRRKKILEYDKPSLMFTYGIDYLRQVGKMGRFTNRTEAKMAFCKEVLGTNGENDGTFNKLYKEHKMMAQIGQTIPLFFLNINHGFSLYYLMFTEYMRIEDPPDFVPWMEEWMKKFLKSKETGVEA